MTVTCSACLITLFMAIAASAQSLEDKVSQARKLQAQSLMGTDLGSEDSLFNEKGIRNLKLNQKRTKKALLGSEGELVSRDSLLAGPDELDSLATSSPDSGVLDSASSRKSSNPMKLRLPLPKRYEQRVFRTIDRKIFASVNGTAGREYILGPGDVVTISIWGDKEKVYDLPLNPEGKVFLEGIGMVHISGNNLDEAQKIIREKVSKVYSGINRGTTHVEVSLGKAGPIRVFVLGEVQVPGGFVFSGQTSIFSALYYAKGPSDIGTIRNLQLTRSGVKYSLDLYKYLIRGESLFPQTLQDGDIIFAGRAEALVEITGDVGRPATYELKKGEGIKELLEFCGGLNSTAANHQLTIKRVYPNGESDYKTLASPQDYLSGKLKAELKDGDRVKVLKSTEPPRNFLTISGPVKYPGTYEATGISSVDGLIGAAGGLRDDAFLGRIHVVRFNPDGSSKLMTYSVDSLRLDSIVLHPKDNVILYSLKEMYLPDSVQISGAVFKPGRYEFRKGETIKDLVMQAGGYLPHYERGQAIVFRSKNRDRKVEQLTLNMDNGLEKSGTDFQLETNDFVQIPVDPKWYQKEIVTLEGLFQHPGKYALIEPNERLVSVINRAGGFKENAYVDGGRFFRNKDSVGRVGVDIRRAIDRPNSKSDIGLVGGDSIYIPERSNTVKVIGEVGFETSVLFKSGSGVDYYIEKAGGFTRRSERSRVVVQYANGETSRDGYFNRKPDAGSVIYVPQGPEPKPIDWFTGINAMLGTLGVGAAIILSIQAISKN